MTKGRPITIALVLGAAVLAGGLAVLWLAAGRRAADSGPASPPVAPTELSGSSVSDSPSLSTPILDSSSSDLPATNVLTITVRNLLGEPIEGAEVSLTAANATSESDSKPVTLTQRNGAALTVASLPHGRLRWRAAAADCQPAEGEFDFRPGNATLTIFLDPLNPPVRGVVVDMEDSPLPGLTISALVRQRGYEYLEARSDDAGRFIFLRLPDEGTLRINVSAGSHSTEPIYVTLPHREDVTLRFDPPGILLGRVIDPASNKGADFFQLKLSDQASPQILAHSDTIRWAAIPGTFRVTIRAGQYRLYVNARNGRIEREGIAVAPGQTTDLGDIMLDTSGASLTLSIRRGTPPQPFTQCQITLIQNVQGSEPLLTQRESRGGPGADGVFKAAGLLEGEYALTVASGGIDEFRIQRDLHFAPNEQKVMDLVIPNDATLEGRVVAGAERQPVEGATLEWNVIEFNGELGDHVTKSVTTDADGRFVIEGLKPETPFAFTVNAPGWATRFINFTPMQEREWLEIEMTSRGGELRGRVVNEDKEGVKAWVTVVVERTQTPEGAGSNWNRWRADTADDGSFFLDHIPGNETLILTASNNINRAEMRLNGLPAEPVIITLNKQQDSYAILRLRVTHADLSPVNGWIWAVSPAAGGDVSLLGQEIIGGLLKWDGFKHFGMTIEFRHKNERARRVFYKDEGDVIEDSVILSAPSRLTVRTLGPDGAALAGASVTISSIVGSGRAGESRTTGAAGEAVFDALPGEYTIRASHSEYLARSVTAALGENESKSVDMRFETGPQLEIQVTEAATGLGVAQAPVTLTSDEGVALLEAVTDDAGLAVFRAIPPGAYGAQVLLAPGVFIAQGGILFDDAQGASQRAFVTVPPLHRITVRFLRGHEPLVNGAARFTPGQGMADMAPNQSLRIFAQTNPRGEAVWSVPAGEYQVTLQPPGFSDTLIVAAGDDGREFEFNLMDHRVMVKVVDAEERKPLAGFEVTLAETPEGDRAGRWGGSQISDAVGQALFTPPFDGIYKAVVRPDKNFDQWESEPLALGGEQREQFIEAALVKKTRPAGQLVLRMVDDQTQSPINEPIENFLIWDFNTGNWCSVEFVFTLPENGVVDISNFPPGYYWAQVLSPHYISEQVTFLMPEEQGMAINLRGARKASARVMARNLPEGFDAAAAFELLLFDPINRNRKRDALWARVGQPTGPFRPGLYYYQFELPGAGGYDGLVELRAGETADIEVDAGAPEE